MTNARVEVYPNPNLGNFEVLFVGEQAEIVEFEVFDYQGKRMLQSTTSTNQAKQVLLSENVSGLYFLRGKSNHASYVARIAVVEH
ncbi:MAG: T9SS type A sorting domain-containing protein [Saprospiraceae bacterium]|nr:T9SS type A sorting domain-containing protein [Saprospiraceae bacterium]